MNFTWVKNMVNGGSTSEPTNSHDQRMVSSMQPKANATVHPKSNTLASEGRSVPRRSPREAVHKAPLAKSSAAGASQRSPQETAHKSKLVNIESDDDTKGLAEELQIALQRVHKKENELSTVSQKLLRSEKNLDELRERFNQILRSQKKQEADTRSLGGILSNTEREYALVVKNLSASQRQLQACKDDLFNLQPSHQVPDTDIVRGFDSVCEKIVEWVLNEISIFEKANPRTPTKHLFSHAGDHDAGKLLLEYPDSGEYLVRYEIHSVLQQEMFGKDVFLLGLAAGTTEVLQKAEQSMATMDPPRDFAAINIWRSETLNAIAATKECIKHRDDHLLRTTNLLYDRLCPIFPIIRSDREVLRRMHQSITIPAADLCSKIKLSSSSYAFSLPEECFVVYDLVHSTWLGGMTFVDVQTRKLVKPNSAVTPDTNGNLGQIVIPLEPDLVRLNKDEDGTKLRASAWLIKLYNPLGKRAHGSHDSP